MDSFKVSNNHVSYHRTPRGGFRGFVAYRKGKKRPFEIHLDDDWLVGSMQNGAIY